MDLSNKGAVTTVRPGEALRLMWERVARRLQAARTRHQMHAMSDHMLRDIGLRRNEIDCLFR